MGWKAVKEHFNIQHPVHLLEGRLCIASFFNSEQMSFDAQGQVVKPYLGTNDEMSKYFQDIQLNREKFVELLKAPDVFGPSVDVFIYVLGSGLLELKAETPQYPGVTHCGRLIHDYFETDKEKAVVRGKNSLVSSEHNTRNIVEELERKLKGMLDYRDEILFGQAELERQYPQWPATLTTEQMAERLATGDNPRTEA